MDQEEKQAALQRQQLLQAGNSTKSGSGAAGAAAAAGGVALGTWQQQQAAAAAEEDLESALDAVRQLFRDYGRLSSGAGSGLMKQRLAGLESRLKTGGEEGSLDAVLEYMAAA